MWTSRIRAAPSLGVTMARVVAFVYKSGGGLSPGNARDSSAELT